MKGQILIHRLLVPVLFLVGINFVHAASFDCSKVTTETEQIICDDPKLSKLDELMVDLHNELRESWYSEIPATVVLGAVRERYLLAKKLIRCNTDRLCLAESYADAIARLVRMNPNVFEDGQGPGYFSIGLELRGSVSSKRADNFRFEKSRDSAGWELQSHSKEWLQGYAGTFDRYTTDFKSGITFRTVFVGWNECEIKDAPKFIGQDSSRTFEEISKLLPDEDAWHEFDFDLQTAANHVERLGTISDSYILKYAMDAIFKAKFRVAEIGFKALKNSSGAHPSADQKLGCIREIIRTAPS